MKLPQGKLFDRKAWSCLCGDLVRWRQGCGCSGGADASWKPGFYTLFEWLNTSITSIVALKLGRDYVDKMSENFETAFVNPGGSYTTPEQSLMAAKVDALTSRTSCGTFFHEPHTAGRINIVFGLEAIQHLRDAGLLKQADKLETEYMDRLRHIQDPKDYGRTLADVTDMMLNQQMVSSQR